MYRVLIVDDEYASRETLKCIIDWNSIGFEEPVCVNSGKKALLEVEKGLFDVIITDIEMPGMDGLELISKIKEINEKQRFVIISCHERFDYARSAIKLGVKDYIIKDLVTSEELYLLMMDIISDVDNSPNKPFLNSDLDNGEIMPRLLELHPGLDKGQESLKTQTFQNTRQMYISMMVVVDSYGKHKAAYGTYQWLVLINSFLSELHKNKLPVINVAEGQFLIVMQIDGNPSMLNMFNSMIQHANFIRMLSKKVGITSISIGISNASNNFEKLSELFKQASKACEMRVLLGLNRNIAYSTIVNKCRTFDKKILDQKIKHLKQLLYTRNQECIPLINSLYSVNLMDGFMEINYFKYLNNRLFSLAQGYVELNLDQGNTYLRENILDFSQVENLETVKEMKDFFIKMFNMFLDYDKCPNGLHGNLVDRAKNFIENNYDKNISLNDIAEEMKVHKGYLCRLFKEQTGENLMHYIINKKIDKAKELLSQTSMRLCDISSSLGFTTLQYFCFVFKKYTDLSPHEYKKAVEDGTMHL
jgi:two-component system response regulator YesN